MSNYQLPEGYKQTEIGVIPEDWDVKQVGEIGTKFLNGGTPSTRKNEYWNGDIPWITGADILKQKVLEIRRFITVDAVNNSSTNVIEKGNLLIATRTGVGKLAIAQFDVAISQDITGVYVNTAQVLPEYLFRYFDFNSNILRNLNQGTSIAGITKDVLRSAKILLPSLKEQRSLAQTLSDVDALIAALDKLIAKKRNLKTATMQQLLTGKKRLPGFGGEWKIISMNKHASLKARIGWQALTTEEYLDSGSFFLVTGTDFIGGRVNWNTCHFVDEWRYSQDKNIQLKNGDILLTKDGTIGKVGYVENLIKPATLNSGVFVIRPLNESFNPLFLYYILSSSIFDNFLDKISAGSTISHLYQKDFVTFEFLSPKPEEQHAIATVLSDMDDAIAALESRLAKTKAVKQGMMQELLTGRTRLIDNHPAENQ